MAVGIGILLGFLSGLGVGGGSLLVLWLTVGLGMAPENARVINLLFFIPCALGALLCRRTGKAPLGKILPAIAAGCVTAFLFSRLNLDTTLLRKLFGGLLIVTGLREIFYTPKKREDP